MKTLMLWTDDDSFGTDPKFLELEGDYSHLHGTFINEADSPTGKDVELTKIIYDEDYNVKVTFLKAPTKDWDFFIHCGFLP